MQFIAHSYMHNSLVGPVKAIMVLSTGGLIAQTVPSGGPILDNIGRLSLDGALIIAVGVLWKYIVSLMERSDKLIAEKDSRIAAQGVQIIEMATKTTEVMTLVMESVKESRKSTEELGNGLDNVTENMGAIQQHMASLNNLLTRFCDEAEIKPRKGKSTS